MRIVLVGLGSVGRSLLQALDEAYAQMFEKRYGFYPRIVAVVDSRGAALNPSGLPLRKVLRAKMVEGTVGKMIGFGVLGLESKEVVDQVEAEVLVEATPTNLTDGEPGLSNIKKALINHMHVVTVNKGPLALAMPSLMELANHNKVQLRFSGTVGGGTPILKFGKECLEGDRVTSIKGVLNGTTNYILTKMDEEGVTMKEALTEAQSKGYAETDPSYDVKGLDTACKLVILANWVLRKRISLRDVAVTGIESVTEKQVLRARQEGRCVKLIGSAAGSFYVKPEALPRDHPLCVKGTLNAVSFQTQLGGEITVVGKGAGGPETACAIIRDLVDVKRTLTALQGGEA
ncbi:MAG: homoserine dehydrogenase [Candidatus Bathyarchaeia archaeon]